MKIIEYQNEFNENLVKYFNNKTISNIVNSISINSIDEKFIFSSILLSNQQWLNYNTVDASNVINSSDLLSYIFFDKISEGFDVFGNILDDKVKPLIIEIYEKIKKSNNHSINRNIMVSNIIRKCLEDPEISDVINFKKLKEILNPIEFINIKWSNEIKEIFYNALFNYLNFLKEILNSTNHIVIYLYQIIRLCK